MAYEYNTSGLGFSDPRGTCSQVSGGETRCFRAREAAAATSNRCRSLSQNCTVGSDAGTMYCCPQFGSVRAPTTSGGGEGITDLLDTLATTGGGSTGGGTLNALRGILGFGVSVPQTTPSGSKTASTAQAVANAAKGVAVTEAAAVEQEIIGPVEESPGGASGSWLSRYQTHITIASTVIGLLTFVIWLVARKK